MRGLAGAARTRAVARAVDLCFLDLVLHQTIDTLSKGYKHRTCLAQALIHDPDVLILDEPTDGLDPNQKHEVRNLIKRMGENKAIVFSTHILEEVEAVCSRVIIIDRGRIVANGTPAELKARSATAGAVHLRARGMPAGQLLERLPAIPGAFRAELISESERGVEARVDVKPSYGLSDDEIARMLQESFSTAGQDMQARAQAEARVELDRMLLATRSALQVDGDLLSAEERVALDALIAAAEQARMADDTTAMTQTTEQLAKGTEAFAAMRMNQGIRQALSGKNIEAI